MSRTFLATFESRELSVLSISSIDASFLYMALAREIRDFYPPESVWPISPSSVWSPAASFLKSSSKQQAVHTFAYHSGSFGRPNWMFCSTVPVTIRGSCSAYTIYAPFSTEIDPSQIGISSSIDISRVVLPEPTDPIIAIFSPFSNEDVKPLMIC